MKIVFFGLGSIGHRHAEILLKNYAHELLAFRSDEGFTKNTLGIKELHFWKEVEDLKPDVVFITNPTSLHIEAAIKCAKIGCKLFMEKPIGKDLNGLDKLLKIIKDKKIVSYVGYNLRFHPVIIRLKKYLEDQKPLHTRVVCTSFLPAWRQNRNHLRSYSANANMGGGVILDLSHELDYTAYLLNGIKRIKGNYEKRSNVTVDAEDYTDLLVDTQMSPVNIHINFLSHLRQRYVQIDFDKLTVIGDIINVEIKEYNNEILNNSYKLKYDKGQEYAAQIKYFFDNINNPNMMNNLVEAADLFREIIAFKTLKHE